MTTYEAAAELGVSRSRVVALIRLGRLRAEKHGRDWFIAVADVRGLVRLPVGRPARAK